MIFQKNRIKMDLVDFAPLYFLIGFLGGSTATDGSIPSLGFKVSSRRNSKTSSAEQFNMVHSTSMVWVDT